MSEKLNLIIEQLKSLTLLEAAELVKEIEVVFGVDTSMSVGTMSAASNNVKLFNCSMIVSNFSLIIF